MLPVSLLSFEASDLMPCAHHLHYNPVVARAPNFLLALLSCLLKAGTITNDGDNVMCLIPLYLVQNQQK